MFCILERNRESIYIFSTRGTTRWSLQQKLFAGNDSTSEFSTSIDLYTDKYNTLLSTVQSPNISSAYVFKIFGNQSFEPGWSLHSRLVPYNETTDGTTYDDDQRDVRPALTNFSTPTVWGGTVLFRAQNEVQIRTQFRNFSCLRIWMSDHYLDGWDTAVLTVVAPDQTNDTFAPHCDQVDPFYVRYCPYDPNDEGVYIIKVFAAIKARFFWEISWRVQVESTGLWYTGDFATKMKFNYNATSAMFDFVEAENLVDFDAPCYRCTKVALQTWSQLQVIGNSALWSLTVTGAPWYISDYQARIVYSSGKVCQGVMTYECYQIIPDGIYILRIGGGLFGRLLGFPRGNATWSGCGVTLGTEREQLVFRISGGQCTALQVYEYTERCARPPSIDLASYSTTPSPTAGGTVAPTQSVFGEPYVKGQMYASTASTGHRLHDHNDNFKHLHHHPQQPEQQPQEPEEGASREVGGALGGGVAGSRSTFRIEDIMQRHHGSDEGGADTSVSQATEKKEDVSGKKEPKEHSFHLFF